MGIGCGTHAYRDYDAEITQMDIAEQERRRAAKERKGESMTPIIISLASPRVLAYSFPHASYMEASQLEGACPHLLDPL